MPHVPRNATPTLGGNLGVRNIRRLDFQVIHNLSFFLSVVTPRSQDSGT